MNKRGSVSGEVKAPENVDGGQKSAVSCFGSITPVILNLRPADYSSMIAGSVHYQVPGKRNIPEWVISMLSVMPDVPAKVLIG